MTPQDERELLILGGIIAFLFILELAGEIIRYLRRKP